MSRRRRKSTEARGDCYQSSFERLMDACLFLDKTNLKLVHAEVAGQGPLAGVTFGHAFLWNENTGEVWDNSGGRNLCMPREAYFRLGRIEDIGNYWVYTWEEARRKALEYMHYGPWDLQTATGL